MIYRAYGKINLGLDVKGTREDGYHEVDMVMQTVGIYDTVKIEKKDDNSFKNTGKDIRLTINNSKVPSGEGNLMYKAAALIKKEYALGGCVVMKLNKVIPIAAGLAGGSSDCAAVLKGMNDIYNLGLSEKALCEKGRKLGADVPYCIKGGSKRCGGIGEIISDISRCPDCCILLAKPDIYVSTKEVYKKYDIMNTDYHPDIGGLIKAMEKGSIYEMAGYMGNSLEIVTKSDYPVISTLEEIMGFHGAAASVMSGSGPTVFGLFDDEKKANNASKDIFSRGLSKQIFVTKPVDNISIW